MRFVLATALLALIASAAAAGSSGPRLALVQASPVVVRGTGFTPGRTVSVTYSSGATRARRTATVTVRGTVRVVFRGIAFDRCRGAAIRAVGASGVVVLPCSAPNGRPSLAGTLVGFVRGSAFVPGEHVRVTARTSGTNPVSEQLDAGPTGSFVAHLAVPRTACAELFFRAAGSLGSNATLTLAAPACKTP